MPRSLKSNWSDMIKRLPRICYPKTAVWKAKQKSGTLTQQVQDLRYQLEVTRDKANDEVYNLKSLLNVDSAKK